MQTMYQDFTQQRCIDTFDYNPDTGILYWKDVAHRPIAKGSIVGSRSIYGYIQTYIKYKYYYVHKLIWLYVYGEVPNVVTHINGDIRDNRLCNLTAFNKINVSILTSDLLRTLMRYDVDTGKAYWIHKMSAATRLDREIGHIGKDGYIRCSLGGRMCYLHKLIFMYAYGYMPTSVGHINGVKTDNRLSNLVDRNRSKCAEAYA